MNNTIKNALFNGRINNGCFRRGLWSIDDLKKAQIENKPDYPDDAIKLFYSDGSIAFYINNKKQLIKNINNRISTTTQAIIDLFKKQNPDLVISETDALPGASRGGTGRDWDAVFTL